MYNFIVQVAFIGHRQIEKTEELKQKLTEIVATLIKEGADKFLFGSKSAFDDLCYEVVTKLKRNYPHIKRIYVRAMYEELSDYYEKYLLESYEQTIFPEGVSGAGYRSYVKRNQAMIDMCDILVTYFDKDYTPMGRSRISKRSGTMIAVQYAEKKKKRITNVIISTPL